MESVLRNSCPTIKLKNSIENPREVKVTGCRTATLIRLNSLRAIFTNFNK